ncbi:HEAT repeat domain-containing protein [Aeoliella sp. SH292]|uniref:HEAT repeat domain-containing protein n=1 Tax=Aeoliella sp. SH292 TaxID=3454464 RepID=UPI003F999214
MIQSSNTASRKRQRPEFVTLSTSCSGRLRSRLALVALLLCASSAFAQEPLVAEPIPRAVASPTALQNPAIRASLAMPRTTPGDYVRGAMNLLNLGEPALAANDVRDLVALGLDDAAKAKLVSDFGAAALIQLSRIPDAGPEAAEFVQSALAAASAASTSDDAIAELLTQLGSNVELDRQKAVARLAGAGEPAVVPLIQLLAKPDTSDAAKQGARAALVRLGPLAERPLLATLGASDPKLVAEAAELLRALGTGEAAPLLAVPALRGGSVGRAYESFTGQVPSVESATGLLERTLKTLEGGAPVFEPNVDGTVTYWVWSEKGYKPVPHVLRVGDANTLYAAELAKQLASLKPGIPSIESKALRLSIEATELILAATQWPDLSHLSADQLDRLLTDALRENQVASATLALKVIAERRDPAVLFTSDGLPSPTAKALEHPHPSVRIAALEAIAAINPAKPFPGASKVRDAIVGLATASGKRQVVVAAPRIDAATTWGGNLSSAGFDALVASTGGDAVKQAGEHADVELVLIDMAIGKPAVRDTVFQLRRQAGSGLVPIALFAREEQWHTAETIAREHQGVMSFPRPHSAADTVQLAEDALAQLPVSWPTVEERLAQAESAMTIMNTLLAGDRDFYRLRAVSDLVTQNVRPAAVGEANWEVLAKLGTHDSQVTLLSYASAPALDLAARQAAAKAFAESVKQFGLTLSSDEIVRQYHLYNASETDTPESQQVFGSLLDTIEAGKGKVNNVQVPNDQ